MITIIILLILAGVSIATLTESGLFEKARQAEQKSENVQIKEEATLGDYENIINNYLSEEHKLSADEIDFIPKDSSWNVQNVKEALDYLYNNL